MRPTLKQAKETTVYVIDRTVRNVPPPQPINLYELVMQYAEETTTPHGNGRKLYIKEIYTNGPTTYELWTWGIRGNSPALIDQFEEKEEAEERLFHLTWVHDFLPECAVYYSTEAEATEAIIEHLMSIHHVTEQVARSHYRRLTKLNIARQVHEEQLRQEAMLKLQQAEFVAPIYAAMIQPIKGESFESTCSRLTAALKEKVSTKAFFKAVKLIRRRRPELLSQSSIHQSSIVNQ